MTGRGARPGGLHAAALAAVALASLAAPGEAQEPAPAPAPVALRPPVLVVEDLLGQDWKAARAAHDELARIGARAVPSLLRARAAGPATAEVREVLDGALSQIVRALGDEVVAPLADPGPGLSAPALLGGFPGAIDLEQPDESIPTLTVEQLGDAGSSAAQSVRDPLARRARARRARGALALLGPAVTGPLLEVPPLRAAGPAVLLARLAGKILEAERERLLAARDAAGRARIIASYRGLADLAAPVVAAGLRDPEAIVRAVYQDVRDEALAAALGGLDAQDAGARQAAEDALCRLDHIAAQALGLVARGEDAARASVHARDAATRVARRIRFGLSRDLVRRLGDDLDGYDELDFRARRARVIEIERLGGQAAIPCLRALLREEPSASVRAVAAIGLWRQKDPVGVEWLMRNGDGAPLSQITPRELAAIYMDQGLKDLSAGRFDVAEREFRQVVELEPTNEVAWYNLACTYSRWGRLDLALEHLKKAIEHGFDDVSHMEKDPDLAPLRTDPRYRALMDELRARRPAAENGGGS